MPDSDCHKLKHEAMHMEAPGEGTDGAKQAARGRLMMMYYTDNRAPRADPFACVSFTPLRAGSNMMNRACCC